MNVSNRSPPPPAYSEQEFDRKIEAAEQVSLALHQQEEEGSWETWDDNAFESAVAGLEDLSLNANSGRRLPAIPGASSTGTRPLQVHKKNPSGGDPPVPTPKPRPSWLSLAEQSAGGSSSQVEAVPAYTPSSSSSSNTAFTFPTPQPAQISAPPSPISPLPDPYNNQTWSQNPSPPTDMTPTAQSITASRHVSLPSYGSSQTNLLPENNCQPQRMSMQNPISYSQRNEPRYSVLPNPVASNGPTYIIPQQLAPQNGYRQPQNISAPRLNFDVSVAHGKRRAVNIAPSEDPIYPNESFNASAFYNSAVSAHMSFPKPAPIDNHRLSHFQKPVSSNASAYSISTSQPYTSDTRSLYNHQFGTQSYRPDTQSVYNQLPPGAGLYNPYTSVNANPAIRSPTPTYPRGTTSNPDPQMLVAAATPAPLYNPYNAPHTMGREQVGHQWADYDPYRVN